MPELPEVEVMRQNIESWVGGGRLARLELLDAALLRMPRPHEGVMDGSPPATSLHRAAQNISPDSRAAQIPAEALANRTLRSVTRRGKHLLMHFCEGISLHTHCRMTGQWVRAALADPVRARLHFHDRACIEFRDPRRLGELRIFAPGGADAYLEGCGLGPEPWPAYRDGEWWRARLRPSRRTLKSALMDQRALAGIGNILASEICFEAGIDPARTTASLTPRHWDLLSHAAPRVIDRIIEGEAGSEIRFISESRSGAPEYFSVYGRAGESCPRCGGKVERSLQAGRATFHCAACQS